MLSSILSDLKKTTAVVESLSTIQPDVLFQRIPAYFNIKYLSLIDASSGYQNLRLEEQSSYLTTFAFQFEIYRYKQLPFGGVPAGNMF